ncbi:MAG: hypothetical protein E5X86_22720 [Mesorhizobium sp.]|uniref:Uncharacterized protein n=1 Tax=Mesorhizobium temperatum TaxID=241416 RepID=A0A271LRW5_9HYPH|nr:MULTISPECIES: hypothetical protein [Mesorhizobium]PAQ10517.1 hypothetical protein CIT26_07935 [Mesorhizobium temperatum]TIO14932.1 MAG: hypothetical protein E5X86_22720 [Mesorhizobium sp.]
MTRALAISSRQITAICKGVSKAGFVAEVVINGAVVRLVPEGSAQSAASPSVDERLDHMFDSSRERATVQPPYDNAVSDYYRKLGYNPRTMNDDDFRRLVGEADARWKAEIPTLPLNKRELEALRQLNAYGPNVPVLWSKIKNCGPDTTERLQARGFLETTPHPKDAQSVEFLVLTDAGQREAAKQET